MPIPVTDFEPEIAPFITQRLEASRSGPKREKCLVFEGNHDHDTISNYFKYLVVSNNKFKNAYEAILRDNPSLAVANQLKTDLRIMFDTGRYYDTIIIPSDGTNDMVIPLSIHRNEINTFHKISTNHKVHQAILRTVFTIFKKVPFQPFRRVNSATFRVSFSPQTNQIAPCHNEN